MAKSPTPDNELIKNIEYYLQRAFRFPNVSLKKVYSAGDVTYNLEQLRPQKVNTLGWMSELFIDYEVSVGIIFDKKEMAYTRGHVYLTANLIGKEKLNIIFAEIFIKNDKVANHRISR